MGNIFRRQKQNKPVVEKYPATPNIPSAQPNVQKVPIVPSAPNEPVAIRPVEPSAPVEGAIRNDGALVVTGGVGIRIERRFIEQRIDIKTKINTMITTEHKVQEGSSEKACIICFENTVEIMLELCCHKQVCLACIRKMHTFECPICKEPIIDIKRIFD